MEEFTQPHVSQLMPSVVHLVRRIHARFPKRDLYARAQALHELAKRAEKQVEQVSKPNNFLRITAILFSLVVSAALIWGYLDSAPVGATTRSEFFALVEALASGIVSLAVVLLFVFSLERRVRRQQIIEEVEKILSLVIAIDLGQQKKEPAKTLGTSYEQTEHSVKELLTPTELERYLEYCGEMAATAKALALCYLVSYSDEMVQRSVQTLIDVAQNLENTTDRKLSILYRALEKAPKE